MSVSKRPSHGRPPHFQATILIALLVMMMLVMMVSFLRVTGLSQQAVNQPPTTCIPVYNNIFLLIHIKHNAIQQELGVKEVTSFLYLLQVLDMHDKSLNLRQEVTYEHAQSITSLAQAIASLGGCRISAIANGCGAHCREFFLWMSGRVRLPEVTVSQQAGYRENCT